MATKSTISATPGPAHDDDGGDLSQAEIDAQQLVDFWKSVTPEDVQRAEKQAAKLPPAHRLANRLRLIDTIIGGYLCAYEPLIARVIDYYTTCDAGPDDETYRPQQARVACADLRPGIDEILTAAKVVIDDTTEFINGIHRHMAAMEALAAKKVEARLHKLLINLRRDIQSQYYMLDADVTFHTSEVFTRETVNFQNSIRDSYLVPIRDIADTLTTQPVVETSAGDTSRRPLDDKTKKAIRTQVKAEMVSHLEDDDLVRAYREHGSTRKAAAALSNDERKVSKDKVLRAVHRAGGIKEVMRATSSNSIVRPN